MAGEAPRRVLLVGFMASGKTSVGRELAALLEWEFHDFDSVIEDRAGVAVSEIFDRQDSEVTCMVQYCRNGDAQPREHRTYRQLR